MKWVVNSKGERIILTGDKLVGMLAEKVRKIEKPDIDHLVTELSKTLEANGILNTFKVSELIHLGWMMGYYHRVFLDKNSVTLETESEDTNSIDKSPTASNNKVDGSGDR